MGVTLKGRDLLCTQDWSVDELEAVLDLAVEMKRGFLIMSTISAGLFAP